MLTKRMMLGAGALALAVAVAACSEDRAGGATGVTDVPPGPRVDAPAAVAITRPTTPDVAAPGGATTQPPSGSDGGVSFTTNGHQYAIQVVPGSNGGEVTRIVQDGVILLEAAGTPASLETAPEASITLFFEGQAVFSDIVSLQGTSLAAIPEQFRSAQTTPAGLQLQAAMPCITELAAFGSASAWLSLELFLARNGAGSLARLRTAVGAVFGAGLALYKCLAANW